MNFQTNGGQLYLAQTLREVSEINPKPNYVFKTTK